MMRSGEESYTYTRNRNVNMTSAEFLKEGFFEYYSSSTMTYENNRSFLELYNI